MSKQPRLTIRLGQNEARQIEELAAAEKTQKADIGRKAIRYYLRDARTLEAIDKLSKRVAAIEETLSQLEAVNDDTHELLQKVAKATGQIAVTLSNV
ncbi:MAG: ribbon-helix-helix protein, CopG family [Candidatus Thiodiazotropha taylori]|nr:ribbon-helix-helix protein, CopG family [Candidatus Thiodiazotropha taylori]MCG8095365.1 ribbon-helix-helix protein, CopG family [Candidatus Thiodiazotropha endolucinida]MCG7882919.1 ribbon-helix-helix protein, CopG family [Candidatus Thiodiazotropha taylori]MCG7888539.1 ribbon-helix-helix protein, CopG family [Candidatus Thiodiazotropha taylori]MCG7892267.1 ribbon-helix-helix protein, CopG family [Candidatus Thiodiazotropha taylori]